LSMLISWEFESRSFFAARYLPRFLFNMIP